MGLFSRGASIAEGFQERGEENRQRRTKAREEYAKMSALAPKASAAERMQMRDKVAGGSNYLGQGMPDAWIEGLGKQQAAKADDLSTEQMLGSIAADEKINSLLNDHGSSYILTGGDYEKSVEQYGQKNATFLATGRGKQYAKNNGYVFDPDGTFSVKDKGAFERKAKQQAFGKLNKELADSSWLQMSGKYSFLKDKENVFSSEFKKQATEAFMVQMRADIKATPSTYAGEGGEAYIAQRFTDQGLEMPENFAREGAAAAQQQEERIAKLAGVQATTASVTNDTEEKKKTIGVRLETLEAKLIALKQKTDIEEKSRATKLLREQEITRLQVIETDLAQAVTEAKERIVESKAKDAENKTDISTETKQAQIDLAKAETLLKQSSLRVKTATESAQIEEKEAQTTLAEVKARIGQSTELNVIALKRLEVERTTNNNIYLQATEAVKIITSLGDGSDYAMSLPPRVRAVAQDILRAAGLDVDFAVQAIQKEEEVYQDVVANQEESRLGQELKKASLTAIENAGSQLGDVFTAGTKANVDAIKKNPKLMGYVQVANGELAKFNVTTGFAADVLSNIISGDAVERGEEDSAQHYVQKVIQHVSGLYGAPTSINKSITDRLKRTVDFRQVRALDFVTPGTLDIWNNAASPDGSGAPVDYAKNPSNYPKMLTTDKLNTRIVPGMRKDVDDLNTGKNNMDISAIDAEIIAVKSQQYVWANIAGTRAVGGLGDATRNAVRTAQVYLSALNVRRKDLTAQANTSRKASVAAQAMKKRYNDNWAYWQRDYKKLPQYSQIEMLFQSVANGRINSADERYIIESMKLNSMTRGMLANRIKQIRGNI